MVPRVIPLLFILLMSACETAPSTMDPLVFEADMTNLSENPSVASVDIALEQLLARPDLTDTQRATVLLARGEKRLDGRLNLPGAIADFDQFIALQPDAPNNAVAERRKLFAAEEIDAAQRRLAQLQNLSNWFDDKVLMGEIGVAAARYQAAELTPNPAQLYLLRESGYICADPAIADLQPVQKYGAPRDDTDGAVWCEDPSVS